MADALAVMDATDAEQAILVGLSFGGLLACILAAYHPERVKAAILVGTAATIGPGYPYMAPQHFLAKREQFEGWDKFNRDYWLTNYPDFAEHFIRNIFTEPHSTKQIEDGVGWAATPPADACQDGGGARRSRPPSTSARRCIARSAVRC